MVCGGEFPSGFDKVTVTDAKASTRFVSPTTCPCSVNGRLTVKRLPDDCEAAEPHGIGRQDRIGSIAVGKNADLVVVKGNPAERIADIENVEIVFKDGIGFDPGKLLDSVKGRYGQY